MKGLIAILGSGESGRGAWIHPYFHEIMREIIAKINIDKIQYKKADLNT